MDSAVLVLEGKTAQLVSDLTAQMEKAAEDLRFEEAARLRDRIRETKIHQEIFGSDHCPVELVLDLSAPIQNLP